MPRSNHLFGLAKRCQSLGAETRNIIQPVIQNNGFYAHSESILLTMIVDNNKNLRKLAYFRIMKARKSESFGTKRVFKVPKINFNAQNYGDMIPWETEYLNDDEGAPCDLKYLVSYKEPPVLSDLSEEALLRVVEEGKVPGQIHDLPCHNQRVERAIKLVSRTSMKAAKKEDREGIIQTVISSRQDLPKFETKKDFKVKWRFHGVRDVNANEDI